VLEWDGEGVIVDDALESELTVAVRRGRGSASSERNIRDVRPDVGDKPLLPEATWVAMLYCYDQC
jgi:hypothetical protein